MEVRGRDHTHRMFHRKPKFCNGLIKKVRLVVRAIIIRHHREPYSMLDIGTIRIRSESRDNYY